MTKEELGKEAYDYADWFLGASPSKRSAIKQAYLAGAVPREKRITELKKEKHQVCLECGKRLGGIE